MLTLLLLRHAKSSRDDPELTDHERPLNKRGTRDAARMGRWLRNNDLHPDLVLCSRAVRTRATVALVLAELGSKPPPVRFGKTLYLAEPDAILAAITTVTASAGRLLIVAHNPGLHMLALSLAGSGDRKALAALAEKLPTAGLVVLDSEANGWDGIAYGTCRLRALVTPRLLA